MSVQMFAPRDRSIHGGPSKDRILHAMTSDNMAACDPSSVSLDESIALTRAQTRANQICRRGACMKKWMALEEQ